MLPILALLSILLPQPPDYKDYRHVLPCLALGLCHWSVLVRRLWKSAKIDVNVVGVQ